MKEGKGNDVVLCDVALDKIMKKKKSKEDPTIQIYIRNQKEKKLEREKNTPIHVGKKWKNQALSGGEREQENQKLGKA